jgi:2-keto-4-pentenoate hydratase/2-oxohepta-3-ene-1,7-dioic acid hydratase in catechol pathway
MEFMKVYSGGEARWVLSEAAGLCWLDGDPFSQWVRAGEVSCLAGIRFLPPCAPTKIVAVGVNYRSHAEEMGTPLPEEPIIFLKPPSSVVSHRETIVYPSYASRRVDYEGELALIIGTRARRISPEEAPEHILGYTCANDVTARDLQRQDMQWTRSKAFDTFCPLGPVIATDVDPTCLSISTRVNGELRQRGSTSDMVFPPKVLVSYISQIMTLEPGDVILTGTPSGVGELHPGDTVEVEIDGIGTLTNVVGEA